MYYDCSFVKPLSTGVPVPVIYEPQHASMSKLTCNFVLDLSSSNNLAIFLIVFSIPPSSYICSGENPFILCFFNKSFSP